MIELLFYEGILFVVIGIFMSVFAGKLMKFQAYTNKKLFDITMKYTPKTIRIMRWFPGIFFVILGIVLVVIGLGY